MYFDNKAHLKKKNQALQISKVIDDSSRTSNSINKSLSTMFECISFSKEAYTFKHDAFKVSLFTSVRFFKSNTSKKIFIPFNCSSLDSRETRV